MTPVDILGLTTSELRINHKLYERHHLQDFPFGKKVESQAGKLKGKVLETILEFGPTVVSSSQPLTFTMKNLIIDRDRTIQSYENMLDHIYEQQLSTKI